MNETSIINWQTGTPPHTGEYLIKLYDGKVVVDSWLDPDKFYDGEWYRHDTVDVIAWCDLDSII